MENSIAKTLRGPHQIFILNYFLSWLSHPDWIMNRCEVPFQENGYQLTQSLWRSAHDWDKAIAINLNENPSSEACLANLDVTARASAGTQIEAGEVKDPERSASLRTLGSRVLVDYDEVSGDEMTVSRVNYQIGNIGVEIQSVGATPCYLEEIRDLAINFFLIPSIARDKFVLEKEPQFSVEVGSESSQITIQDFTPKRWYLLLVGQDDCQIAREDEQLLIRPGNEPLHGIPIFLLSVDREGNKVVSGPVIHP